MIEEYAQFAVSSVGHRKRRSWLTILGIFIGIAAVVALISVSQGLKDTVSAQFELMGTDTITVMPGRIGTGPPGFGAAPMTEDDLKAIEKVRGVDIVAPMIFRQTKVELGSEEVYVYVMGTPADKIEDVFFSMDGIHVIEGRLPPASDRFGAVVGHLVVDDLFDKKVNIGSKLKIGEKDFKVRGVLTEVGNRQDDTQIYIHLDTAREIFDEPEEIDAIMLKVKAGSDPEKISGEIEEELEDLRGKKDFSVMTSKQLAETVNVVLGVVQLVLVGIAGISLLVGGVGIMNTMYTSVQERTREIGIMKAIGATNESVLTIFLMESGLLGLVGGSIGCVLGMMLALGVEYGAAQAGFSVLKAAITWELVALALGFSFIVGMLSGALPARRASKMNPVDALRYE